ncbi:hypothetical protein [Enhygromyxa salina]|uniref:Uncharacterized protein n=1 Tax=Enhygromyxa salina TaxID=215803 RepID=A0A2S9YYC5_9BACT|nr:hypothetical protein [Enhygromyxa salina]PRQ10086.1 hypothetical protein ENSA7_02920 [Enhygromyxa salina]
MLRSLRLCLALPLSLLGPLACADDGGGDGALDDAGETGDGDGDGDGDPTGDGDGDPTGDGDGDPTGDGDGDPTGDGDGDPTGDGDGDPGVGMRVDLLLNSNVIREANNDGELTAACMLFENGLPAAVQPAFEYTVSPVDGVVDSGNSWAFESFGTWTIECSTQVDSQELSSEHELAVLNDAIDSRLADVGAALGTSGSSLAAVLAADGGDDQLLIDAITTLATAGAALADPNLDLAGLDDVLVPLPGGYPSDAALDDAGILANADDAALTGALAQVNAALDELTMTYAGFDPQVEPSEADLAALEAAGVTLDAALTAAMALEPTTHGLLANRQTLAASIRDHMSPALLAINEYVIARAQAEADGLFGIAPPDPFITSRFGLIGLTLGMFNQSYIRVRLINDWYGDAIKQLDKSINNLILSDLIDYLLPPNPNGPVIELFSASASVGFAVPGYDTWAYGSNFNSDPAFNLFIILGDQWQGVVDQILGACGVSEDNSIPENIDALNGCVDQIEMAVDSAINYSIEVVEPGLLGDQDVHIGPFPAVCEGFLPVATLVIPINLAVGRGETWQTNCLP